MGATEGAEATQCLKPPTQRAGSDLVFDDVLDPLRKAHSHWVDVGVRFDEAQEALSPTGIRGNAFHEIVQDNRLRVEPCIVGHSE